VRSVAAVIVGAIVGTALRLTLDTVIPHAATGFPLSTLLINIVGSFALGVFVARVWGIAPPWLKAGLGAGLVGTFTTFSAFALSLVQISAIGDWGVAALYLVLTMLLGVAAAFAGLSLARRRAPVDLENE
jgi:fluoride exporter